MSKGGYRGGYSGGRGGMVYQADMMKQAKKLQDSLEKMQAELETASYSASSGGGVVEAVVNGSHELTSLKIDPDAVDPEDIEILQDMIIAAVNEALRLADDTSAKKMNSLTGGLNLPF